MDPLFCYGLLYLIPICRGRMLCYGLLIHMDSVPDSFVYCAERAIFVMA